MPGVRASFNQGLKTPMYLRRPCRPSAAMEREGSLAAQENVGP
jgi:hypothetical protein